MQILKKLRLSHINHLQIHCFHFYDQEDINPDDYEELTKPTTVAVNSFFEGQLKWTNTPSEAEEK